MTIDPHIPTMPGRSTSGFHQPGRGWVYDRRGMGLGLWRGLKYGEELRGVDYHINRFLEAGLGCYQYYSDFDFCHKSIWQVTGIFFESKVDYTTWFGDNVEYIHGIQVKSIARLTMFFVQITSGSEFAAFRRLGETPPSAVGGG